MVMDYCPGGDLFNRIHQHSCLEEEEAQFYAACVVIGLSYMHENDIVYGDLKPENVLIDHNGYAKLSDFGVSYYEGDRDQDETGTKEYLAPEVLSMSHCGMESDWWAFGCFIYEMVTGELPFKGGSIEELENQIMHEKIECPYYLEDETIDVIHKLTMKDKASRLGSKGIYEVRSHPFFSDINWDEIEK